MQADPSEAIAKSQLEALKLLKDWSVWLVTVQAVALGLLSALWGKDSIKLAERDARRIFLCFGLSIVCATLVLGGVPDIAQRLPYKSPRGSAYNIYEVPLYSWLPDGHWLTSLWAFATLEHALFLAGIGAFMWGVLRGKRGD